MTKIYLNKSFQYSLTLFTMEIQEKCEVSEIITEYILPRLYGSQIRVMLSHWYPGSGVVPDYINS